MAEMTPRERSELVRSQSRAYIAALRQNRLQRTAKTAPLAPPIKSIGKMPSAFYPSRQATARAFEAKSTSAPQPEAAVPASGNVADLVRGDADVSLGQLRGARRPRKARVAKTDAAAMQAAAANQRPTGGSAKKLSGAATLDAKPVGKDLPKGSVAHSEPASPVVDETPPVVQRRARSRRTTSGEQPVGILGTTAEPRDIDAISGLGPALKAKLRRAGIGTADVLASQTAERLREVLGPAGRLVNLDALVRAAATACAPDRPVSGGALPARRSAPSSRTGV